MGGNVTYGIRAQAGWEECPTEWPGMRGQRSTVRGKYAVEGSNNMEGRRLGWTPWCWMRIRHIRVSSRLLVYTDRYTSHYRDEYLIGRVSVLQDVDIWWWWLYNNMNILCGWCLVTTSHPAHLRLHGLYSARLLCPRDFLGKNSRVGCHFPSPGALSHPEIKPNSPAWQANSLPLSHLETPWTYLRPPNCSLKNG